jgi:exopolysaccharide biosynthesis protein
MNRRHKVIQSGLALAITMGIGFPVVANAAPKNSAASAPVTLSTTSPTTPAYWPTVLSEKKSPIETITSGVTHYSESFQTVNGPIQTNVTEVDLTNPNVRLGVTLANNKLYSPDETVSSMANRTGAVAGINGDFFDINATGAPLDLTVVNGRIVESQYSNESGILGVTKNGRISIAPEVFTASVTSSSGSSYSIESLNRPGTEANGNLTLITSDLGASFPVSNATVAYLKPDSQNSSTKFTVEEVDTNVSQVPQLHPGEEALVAGGGNAASWVTSHLKTGSKVHLHEKVSPNHDLEQALGTGYILLENGQWYNDPNGHGTKYAISNALEPLTAVGVSRDGRHMYMVVVDGRQPNLSIGLSYKQMASYLQSLGAYKAVMLDGGGSSEMVVRHHGYSTVSVVNSPSDGHERPVADGLFVYSTKSGK